MPTDAHRTQHGLIACRSFIKATVNSGTETLKQQQQQQKEQKSKTTTRTKQQKTE